VNKHIKAPARWDIPYGKGPDETAIDALLARPPFNAISDDRFRPETPLRGILKNDSRLIDLPFGSVIYRQGDYGTSAFFVLEGEVRDVRPESFGQAASHKPKRRRITSLHDLLTKPRHPEVRSVASYLRARSEAALTTDPPRALIPDVLERPAQKIIKAGALFGEIGALNRSPRAHTMVASANGTTVLEIRWQGLRDLMQADAGLQEYVDQRYREQALRPFLRKLPQLAGLDAPALQAIADATTFVTYGDYDWSVPYQQLIKNGSKPDEPIIVQEGDYAEDIYILRSGFARVHVEGQTTNYIGAGEVFALPTDAAAYPATLSAAGYAHLLKIPRALIPDAAPASTLPGSSLARPKAPATPLDPELLGFMAEHRFLNGTAAMVINLDRCTRCDDCVRACASTHDNNPRFLRHGPTHGPLMVAQACMHCQDPVCLLGCPTGAIHRSPKGGQVIINDPACIGCGACSNNCPYDAIRMVAIKDRKGHDVRTLDGFPIQKATKCDLCLDSHDGPACVKACPHDALTRVDMRGLMGLA
jgi:Fe-S-cluster-containing dehydrogenase component/CRP-like cAMP-binding protein